MLSPTVAVNVRPASTISFSVEVGLDKKVLDLSELPKAAFRGENGEIMVPLRAIAESLGYKVTYDEATGDITVDDEYIQAATLKENSAEVSFKGHLQIIDMSRDIELSAAVKTIDGTAYVPASFFGEFFNEVIVNGTAVSIAPIVYTLDTDI